VVGNLSGLLGAKLSVESSRTK
ncbi:unnamed protein product, partial [Allacma fusca]